jgi:NAD(P)-dependent dehydrogenase (short-subunit alcohol dehydrogenase family)
MATRPRHVLITGGSRGIGLSIAQLFAKNSYRCTLISRSEDDLRTAVATLQPLPPPSPDTKHQYTHGFIPGNITAGKAFWSLSENRSFGAHLPKPRPENGLLDPSRIDVLVNCAGVTQAKLFLSMNDGDIQSIINTNLVSLMHGTKFLIRNAYFEKKKAEGEEQRFSPVVINVSSLLGLQSGYGAVAYAASKAGVLGFTRALATEYASHGVRMNAIVPGYIETDMTKGMSCCTSPLPPLTEGVGKLTLSSDLNASELQKRIPLRRFGTPEEIAHAALFLAENQYAHNCVINLDGGLSAV